MSPDEPLHAEVWLGAEVEKFLETDTGRYLQGRCENEFIELQNKLADIDPNAFNSLVELQNAINGARFNMLVNRKVMSYLTEAVINGRNAYGILVDKEE